MSKKISRVVALGVAVATVVSLVLASAQSVSAYTGNTESSLKSALQYAMLYQCAQDYGDSLFADQTAIGEKTSSIINDYSSYTEYIGTAYGLGDSNGNITCRKLIEDVFGAGKISDSTVSRGLLKGVYEYAGSSEKKISCSYGIINSEKSGMIDNGKEYYWPAGYYDGANGFVNQTGHGAISVVYDENGPIRLEGATSDVDVEHALASLRNRITDWKRDDTICSSIVEATEIYSYQAPGIQDPSQTITTYTPIRSNTCDAMESVKCFWLNGNNTENAAWINKASPVGYWYHVEDVADATKLMPTDDAATNFKANIQSLFLDGSAGLAAFLNDHPDAKYLLYGRYLFNGDNGNSGGCRVTSVPKSDITEQKIDTTYWDTSLSYIKEFSPWNDSGAKVDYVGKIGGNGVAEEGADFDVSIPGGVNGGREVKMCSVLMDDFKSVIGSVSGSAAKKTVYSYIGAIPATELPDSNDPSNPGSTGGQPENEVSSITACYQNAGVLGWIACPVLEVMSGVVEGLYDYIEGNFLQVKNGIMQSNGLRSGWVIFRDFANILFAIAFAVVILSQVTGIGLSNYNIKKILPRLIMVVVLVNISFILCQLAVDVSNIVGSSVKGLFAGFAQTAASSAGGVPFDLGSVIGGIIGSLFTVGASAAVVAVFAITIPWELWLFPVLLTVLACVISILFFFIILGVRQAGIAILITLAPLAVVMYALPNTKSIFEKWWKMFSALLLVYPICGLLVGGGQFASTLLLIMSNGGDTGAFFTIVAMLLSVVPFFMVPSILKSSLSAMGNLGMKISNMGSTFGNRLTSGIRNSAFGQDFQRQKNMDYNARSAQRLLKKQASLKKKGKSLSMGAQRRLYRHGSAYARAHAEDIRAGVDAEIGDFGLPGSISERVQRQNVFSEQESRDIAGREGLFGNGAMTSILPGQNGATVNGEDDAALQGELDAYLDKIVRNDGSESEIREYSKNAQAISNILSDRGTGSARARVVDSLSRAMKNNSAALVGASDTEKARLARDFGVIGSRLNSKYGKDYKKDNPGATALFGDIAKGDFSKAGTFTSTVVSGDQQHIRSTYYSGAGISGLSAEDFSKLKTSGLGNIAQGITEGDISGAQLEALGSLANTVLESNNYSPDSDAIPMMQQIRSAAFANRAPSSAVHGRTTGSLTIGEAGSKGIDSIVRQIQGASTWHEMTAAGDTQQMNTLQNLVSNVSESYQNDRFSQEDASRLHEALKLAHEKGILDASGKVVAVPKAPAQFNVRQEAEQQSGSTIIGADLSESERTRIIEGSRPSGPSARQQRDELGRQINKLK